MDSELERADDDGDDDDGDDDDAWDVDGERTRFLGCCFCCFFFGAILELT